MIGAFIGLFWNRMIWTSEPINHPLRRLDAGCSWLYRRRFIQQYTSLAFTTYVGLKSRSNPISRTISNMVHCTWLKRQGSSYGAGEASQVTEIQLEAAWIQQLGQTWKRKNLKMNKEYPTFPLYAVSILNTISSSGLFIDNLDSGSSWTDCIRKQEINHRTPTVVSTISLL
jgi:hypothetical protein